MDFLAKLFIKDYKNTSDNKVREQYGILSGILGIILNFILFSAKFLIGLLSNSTAISADAFNNLTDAASSVISMMGLKLANKPVDKDHPFGHGRIEYLSSLLVSAIILFIGIELASSSLKKIFNQADTNITTLTIVILIISVLIKIWMFLYNYKFAKRINSLGMKATAIDSINDAIATSIVLISALISYFISYNIDGYVGVLVAAFILFTGIKTAKETIDILLGKAPDKEMLDKITEFVTSYDVVLDIHDLIVHNYGIGRELISLHAEVSCEDDILYIHEKIDEIESDLYKTFHLQAVIHMDPVEVNNERISVAKQDVNSVMVQYYPECSIHDFRMVNGENRINLIFDVVVPFDCQEKPSEIVKTLNDKVNKLNPKYQCVIKIDRPYV